VKQLLRELYGSAILFFYFLKWPILLGYPLLLFFFHLNENYIIDALWLFSLILAIKDFVIIYKKRDL